MKKIATLLVVLTTLTVGVYAQGLSGGVKAGLNLANQTWKASGYAVSPSFKPSFHAGAYVTFMFSERIGLQPELLLSGQGYKQNDYKLNLLYITVPILVRVNVTDFLSFHAGPQIGLLASAKDSEDTDNLKDDIKSTDLGLAVGATVDVKKLNFTFRFVKGLSNIADDDGITVKNYMLQVSVGYTLFGKK